MKGHRLFGSFGFTLPKSKEVEPKNRLSTTYNEWEFNEFVHDWFSSETGEQLSNYQMPFELSNLLQNNIDSELE